MKFKCIGEAKLFYLLNNYKDLAQQGSKAWLEGRRTRFGGSEIGAVTHTNPKIPQKLIQEKVKGQFQTNLYCWWGHCFEPVAKAYLSYNYQITIIDFGAVPSSKYPIAYSPDGVFIGADGDLWLLEIKCPFLRDLDMNSSKIEKIKDEYKKQVQTGLHILPCNKALFSQFKFRKCNYFQLEQKGKYDRTYHREQYRSKETPELWYGAMVWLTKPLTQEHNHKLGDPDFIHYSFNSNPKLLVSKYTNANIMWFKCFYISNQTILKSDEYLRHEFQIWKQYDSLIEQQKS